MVQWLELSVSTAGGLDSIPDLEIKLPQASWSKIIKVKVTLSLEKQTKKEHSEDLVAFLSPDSIQYLSNTSPKLFIQGTLHIRPLR